MNIYLTGFMGCGKSSMGKEIAAALNLEVSDTDALVQEKAGMDIPEIFNRQGEAAFRQMESEVLRSIPDQRLVITGGGLPCSEANWNYMKQHGYIVYIEVPVPVLFERLRTDKNKSQRPLIRHLDDNGLKDYILTAIDRRKAFYERADYIFRSSEQDTKILIEKLKTIKL
ncbi:MAG: shikimate kinase [Bacteroidales bacterium]|nr:shikimate kinase [Bacteroidales bacterium]